MGRKRSIDRDKVLDAAETIVVRDGAKGLTIDARSPGKWGSPRAASSTATAARTP